jgi:hypothetical protein
MHSTCTRTRLRCHGLAQCPQDCTSVDVDGLNLHPGTLGRRPPLMARVRGWLVTPYGAPRFRCSGTVCTAPAGQTGVASPAPDELSESRNLLFPSFAIARARHPRTCGPRSSDRASGAQAPRPNSRSQVLWPPSTITPGWWMASCCSSTSARYRRNAIIVWRWQRAFSPPCPSHARVLAVGGNENIHSREGAVACTHPESSCRRGAWRWFSGPRGGTDWPHNGSSHQK